MSKYWKGEGEFQSEVEELQKLVPGYGKADTLKGEIWRAVTKISYDLYNNGFGNVWMAPAEFLMDHVRLPRDVKEFLKEHANGNTLQRSWEEASVLLDSLIETTIFALRNMQDEPNEYDMWEWQYNEDSFGPNWEEEEEEEEEESSFGWYDDDEEDEDDW